MIINIKKLNLNKYFAYAEWMYGGQEDEVVYMDGK